MVVLEIDGIDLVFDASWSVAKWDDSAWYLNGIAKLKGDNEGTKAVDVIGVRGELPYLFEVKDFRGPHIAIANKARPLPREVGFKVRDTVAGVHGRFALRNPNELPQQWVNASDKHPVQVIVLVAEDVRPGEQLQKRKARFSERVNKLEQSLAWLTPRVWIYDPLRDADSLGKLGITARSQAGAGPARR